MNSKTKFTLTVTAMVMVTLIAVVSIIAVFAARIQNFTSNITVKYTASQIAGKVSAKYYIGPDDTAGTAMTTTGKEGGATELVFRPGDKQLDPNTLNPLEDIILDVEDTASNTPDKSWVVFEYVFQNGLGTKVDTDYVAKLTFKGAADNIKITTAESETPITNYSQITSQVSNPADFTSQLVVKHKATSNYISTKYFYVKAEIDKVDHNAKFEGDFTWDLSLWEDKDLFDSSSKVFNTNNINKLLKQISGDATASVSSMSKINEMATSKTTAAQMREFAVGKNAGEDITITLGGLNWTVTYLSKDKEGNSILTLWLDNCVQEAWTDRSSTEGEYYGFLNGGLYSDFAANWEANNPQEAFPNHMYGASYIRAVTLNGGGVYATSGTQSTTVEQNPNSAFALFTMADGGLTQYLVKPNQVEWQEYGQNTRSRLSFTYSNPNENWSDQIPDKAEYNGEIYYFRSYNGHYFNYANNQYNATWADDYLWLPSLSETGYDDTHIGIWDLSIAQLKNNGGSSSTSGSVGITSGKAYAYSWLRTGYFNNAGYPNYLKSSGDGYIYGSAGNSCAVRPALHLNLTAIIEALG